MSAWFRRRMAWFKPKKVTGWKKEQPASVRRMKLLKASKDVSKRKRLVSAGRRALALSNVTTDKETKVKARGDADYFFNLAKKY